MKRPPGPRESAAFSASIYHQLHMYALSAGAAGVSLLAVTQAAEAKIVYTKAHQVIGANGVYNLDLNHDGTVDFLIQQIGYCNSTTCNGFQRWLLAKEALGNAVEGSIANQSMHFAAALNPGAQIGPRRRFIHGGNNGESMIFVWEDQDFQTLHTYGKWIDLNSRYLGLKFKIGKETHFGWARLSVHDSNGNITAVLTGYAYETVPGKAIVAGQTEVTASADATGSAKSGASAAKAELVGPGSVSQQPASLGALALGAQSVPPRRRP
jgi:hypothetical protein